MPLWIIYAILSALFASLVAIFGKVGIKNIDTTLATTIRAVIMAGFLVITSLFLKKYSHWSELDGRTLWFVILSGVAGALSWLFYFWALKKGPASGVAALDRTSVVFVIIFAALFLGESLTWKTALGGLLILGGALLFVL